jgi:CRP-like cAMP-binding protein
VLTREVSTKLELFYGLPDDVMRSISDLSDETSFAAGTTIFAEGRPADCIYLLLEGTVGLSVYPTSLPQPMTFTFLKSPGQAFGWSAVVGSGYYTASAEAKTDVRAVVMNGQELVDLLTRHPCEAFIVMRRVAEVISHRLATMRTLLLETICD